MRRNFLPVVILLIVLTIMSRLLGADPESQERTKFQLERSLLGRAGGEILIAQEEERSDSIKADTAIFKQPTEPARRSKAKLKRSPMGALMRSIAIPGWGQYYNKKYLKSAVIFCGESFFIYKAAHWWIKTEDQYNTVQTITDPIDKPLAFSYYLSYRGKRDDYLWATGITIFLSMFDAYVDAHLAGFDVDLTPDFQPPQERGAIKLSLRF